MIKCSGCSHNIRPGDVVSAVFTADRKRSFYHRDCEEKVDQFAKWREEAPWAFKVTRLRLSDWKRCGPRKHLGVWQSMFIARRDEDVYCPDCGLKISRHDSVTCPSCSGTAIILNAEQTRMVFSHGEPLYKLQLHCVSKGEPASTYAIISGYTPVAVTARKAEAVHEHSSEQMLLKYQPKGDPKQGLTV